MKGRYLGSIGGILSVLLLTLANTGCGGRNGGQMPVQTQNADTCKDRAMGQVLCGNKEVGPVDTVAENVALGVYSNGTLARKDIVLPDGTRVAMHPGTVLRIGEKFKRGDREIWLEGDALFEVSEGKKGGTGNGKPMIIHTGFLKIEVLAPGSRFRVDAKKKEAGEEADLLAGRLKVMKSYHSDTDNEPDTIVAGEMVMINRDIELMEKEKMDGTEMKGWQ